MRKLNYFRVGILVFVIFGIIILIWFFLSVVNSNAKKNENVSLPSEVAVVTNIWLYNQTKLDNLKNHNVEILFVDIGGTNSNGTIKNNYSDITRFIDSINEYQENSGHNFVLLAYSEVNSKKIDITDFEFKENYIASYMTLIELGFDGMLVDIEPVKFEDREYYIELLKEINDKFPDDAIVAVYTGHIINKRTDNYWQWEDDFYRQVIMNSDIISAPGYDTNITTEKEYREHLKKQIKILSEYNNTKILFAIPTHKPYPETSEIAISTFISEIRKYPNTNITGITVFAEWTATYNDWENVDKYINYDEVEK